MIPSLRLVVFAAIPILFTFLGLIVPGVMWTVLFADGLLALVVAVDAFLAVRPLVVVERRAPAVFSVGRANVVTLEVSSLSRRRLRVQVKDDLFFGAEGSDLPVEMDLGPRKRAVGTYRVCPTRRGAYELGDHFVRYSSPLGLLIRQTRIRARSPVKVYPDVALVRTYELLARQDRDAALVRTRMRGGESEFERLRDHQKDDEFRRIDWKATARRQKLIARDYQLERNQNVLCILDCGRLMTAESDGLSHFDHALNANLMMAHVAARSGDQVGLLAFADQVLRYLPPAGGARAGHRLIQASYDLHPTLVESNYAAAFDLLAVRLRKRSLVVLFTQLVDDVAAQSVLRLMRGLVPRHLPLFVLFRDLEVDELAEPRVLPPVEPPIDLYVRSAAAEINLWREKVVRDLKAGGALVLHVPPKKLTPALVSRYLEIKARQLL
jgi:uncharacterized protein (DUF58 family)